MTVFFGEVVTTFAMISLLTKFLAFRKIRPFTQVLFPPLYSLMVWAERSISGTSTNPARSLGPALISGQWQGGWIYFGSVRCLGPSWHFWCVVFWPSGLRWPSFTILIVIEMDFFADPNNKGKIGRTKKLSSQNQKRTPLFVMDEAFLWLRGEYLKG